MKMFEESGIVCNHMFPKIFQHRTCQCFVVQQKRSRAKTPIHFWQQIISKQGMHEHSIQSYSVNKSLTPNIADQGRGLSVAILAQAIKLWRPSFKARGSMFYNEIFAAYPTANQTEMRGLDGSKNTSYEADAPEHHARNKIFLSSKSSVSARPGR